MAQKSEHCKLLSSVTQGDAWRLVAEGGAEGVGNESEGYSAQHH